MENSPIISSDNKNNDLLEKLTLIEQSMNSMGTRINENMNSMEERINENINSIINENMNSMEERINENMNSMEKRINENINSIEERMKKLDQDILDHKTEFDNKISFIMYGMRGGDFNPYIPKEPRKVAPGISCTEPSSRKRTARIYGR